MLFRDFCLEYQYHASLECQSYAWLVHIKSIGTTIADLIFIDTPFTGQQLSLSKIQTITSSTITRSSNESDFKCELKSFKFASLPNKTISYVIMARSHVLVVKTDDSLPRGCGFGLRHRIMYGFNCNS